MTDLQAIPPLRGTFPPGGASSRPRPASRPPLRPIASTGIARRTVLRAGAVAGMTVGMAAMRVFPAARRAYADGYDIYGSCPSYASDHNCSPGCGPSTIYGDACTTSGANLGFHKDDGVNWTLRPNQCYQSTYDGWIWRYQGACGSCACYVERRCHDGYRQTSSGWVRSICRWNTDCGCPGQVGWPSVGRDSSGPNVYSIQLLLNYRGQSLAVDGAFGPATEAAVRSFQSAAGLASNGVVDAATWPALVVTVRRSDNSDAVRAAQRQLNRYGYALSVDGIFGPLTEGAVRDVQVKSDLTVDGIVGPVTWRTLTGGAGV